jgi:hypothetical protein
MKNTPQTPGQKTGPGNKSQKTPGAKGVNDTKQPNPTEEQEYNEDELSDEFFSDDEEE